MGIIESADALSIPPHSSSEIVYSFDITTKHNHNKEACGKGYNFY